MKLSNNPEDSFPGNMFISYENGTLYFTSETMYSNNKIDITSSSASVEYNHEQSQTRTVTTTMENENDATISFDESAKQPPATSVTAIIGDRHTMFTKTSSRGENIQQTILYGTVKQSKLSEFR